jgi:anti-sigma B factor antagonist
MEIAPRVEGDVKIISVSGHLETSGVSVFRDRFLEETKDDDLILLDCAELEYLDSSGLASLVSLFKTLSARDAKLVICGLSDGILRVIRFTKLDKVFTLADSVNDGLVAVRS